MLIENLKNEELLKDFIKESCEDEGICIAIEEGVEKVDLLVIKPDEYYNSLKIEKRPASVDCMVIQRCKENHFHIYLIELKNVKNLRGVKKEKDNLREKFETCLMDFIRGRFREHFVKEEFEITFKLRLVAGKITDTVVKRHSLKFLMQIPPFQYFGKFLAIDGYPTDYIIPKCF
ncbi:MAG: hypothetical protein ACPG49_12225 [Chitinophagales bacterium]